MPDFSCSPIDTITLSRHFSRNVKGNLWGKMALLIACWMAMGGESTAQAAGNEFSLRGHDLAVTVNTRWAGNAEGGYYPVRIRLVNRGPSRILTFRIAADSRRQKIPAVQQTVAAQQNATMQFTLSVPMVGRDSYGQLSVYHQGKKLEKLSRQIVFPDFTPQGVPRPALLVVSPNQVDCEPFEQAVTSQNTAGGSGGMGYYTARSSDHEIVHPAMLPDSWIDYSGLDVVALSLEILGQLPLETRESILKWVHTGGTLLVYDVGQPASQSQELNRLLKLDRHAFVSSDWNSADPSLRRHVSSVPENDHSHGHGHYGGTVATAVPPQPAEQDQAEQEEEEDQPENAEFAWPGEPETFASRNLMLGKVFAFSENPFPGSRHDWDWFLQTLGKERSTWVARQGMKPRGAHPEFLHFLIPGIQGVPVYSFLVLISLFTIVIGPVNYLILWKRKKLNYLVFTIPAIAFLTSLVLFSYSAIAHGFQIKSRTRSFTVLDQNANTAVTTSRLAIFAGLAPSSGLQFSPETAVYPVWPEGQTFEEGTVDWTEGQNLVGSWLRSRTRTQFVTTSHRAERGRLEVNNSSGNELEVSNGLEWGIQKLLLSDSQGKHFYGENIPAGSSTRLAPMGSQERKALAQHFQEQKLSQPEGVSSSSGWNWFSAGSRSYGFYGSGYQPTISFASSLWGRKIQSLQRLNSRNANLPPRSYIAVLKEPPGIEKGVDGTNEQAGFHVLEGYY